MTGNDTPATQSLEISGQDAGTRLDVLVARAMNVSRSVAQEVIALGLIELDGETITQKSLSLNAGSVLSTPLQPPSAQDLREEISEKDLSEVPLRYQDEHLLVVAKPAGLVVHPAPGHRGATMVDALARLEQPPAGGDPSRPGIVHRLDRDTSGLLVVARSQQVHEALTQMMMRREITRVYAALLEGVIEPDSLTIDAPVGRDQRRRTRMTVVAEGREAVSEVEVEERFSNLTFVSVALRTGRTHQIRVHCSAIDHCVAGDLTYGANASLAQRLGLERPFLHARHLRFLHPVTGQAVQVDEPLPNDLDTVLLGVRAAEEPELDERIPPHRR